MSKEQKEIENRKPLSRRDFLRLGSLTTAGLIVAACGAEQPAPTVEPTKSPEKATEATEAPAPTATPKPFASEPVTLEIRSTQPQYIDTEERIWAIYKAENPNVTIELFSVHKDQEEAYQAKKAGGYVPVFEVNTQIKADNYRNYVNLLNIDFEWWDRWWYDVKNAFEKQYEVAGVYALDFYQGHIFTWQYHKDLMEQAGLDPRSDVKTWDDLKTLLDEGTEWVDSNPDVDRFWDMGYQAWCWSLNYWGGIPLAFADGQRNRQRRSWLDKITKAGKEPDPLQDPFHHTLEFFKEAYDKGWLPENFWLRSWEGDMEANFIAKKAVMILNGPWTWDKMLAADPNVEQLGLPATPPATGQDEWVQFMGPLNLNSGYNIPLGNLDKPEWDQILHAWNWWFSPPTVKTRAEMEGRPVMYYLNEPLELESPQWLGILKEFQRWGLYRDVVIASEQTGDEAVAQYKNEDSGEIYDWNWAEIFGNVAQDKMTIKEALAWFHEQVANDYDLPAY